VLRLQPTRANRLCRGHAVNAFHWSH